MAAVISLVQQLGDERICQVDGRKEAQAGSKGEAGYYAAVQKKRKKNSKTVCMGLNGGPSTSWGGSVDGGEIPTHREWRDVMRWMDHEHGEGRACGQGWGFWEA